MVKIIAYIVIVILSLVGCVLLEKWGKDEGMSGFSVGDIAFDIVMSLLPVLHLVMVGLCIYTILNKHKVKVMVERHDRSKKRRDKKKNK